MLRISMLYCTLLGAWQQFANNSLKFAKNTSNNSILSYKSLLKLKPSKSVHQNNKSQKVL